MKAVYEGRGVREKNCMHICILFTDFGAGCVWRCDDVDDDDDLFLIYEADTIIYII